MMNRRTTFAAAAVAVVVSSALFAQDRVTVVLSVDGVVKQLREQGDMTNLVKKLVASGDVCAVVSHEWEFGCSDGPGCLVIHTGPMRHCLICKKEQTKEIGPWK